MLSSGYVHKHNQRRRRACDEREIYTTVDGVVHSRNSNPSSPWYLRNLMEPRFLVNIVPCRFWVRLDWPNLVYDGNPRNRSRPSARRSIRHWGQGPKYPPATCWIHWEYRQQVTPMCPVGIGWVHFKCPLPWDSNLPRPEQAEYI